jgi:putative nucleotidyltransferase with HDIG domain
MDEPMDYRAVKHHLVARLRNELSDKLFYHGLHHTLDVLRVAAALCSAEGVNGHNLTLVKTAALFHDAGFVKNKHIGHEIEGCNMVRDMLPQYGYSPSDIETICGMIMATKVPQSPQNLLEEILCDADLDYLGRDDFYTIGNSLYEELQAYNVLHDEQSWNRLQVNFLTAHHFHTRTNRELREPVKQRYLEQLRDLVASY